MYSIHCATQCKADARQHTVAHLIHVFSRVFTFVKGQKLSADKKAKSADKYCQSAPPTRERSNG